MVHRFCIWSSSSVGPLFVVAPINSVCGMGCLIVVCGVVLVSFHVAEDEKVGCLVVCVLCLFLAVPWVNM